MRVNVYAEELTDRVEIISKTIDGQEFTGVRFYLELPATVQMPVPGTGATSGAPSTRPENVRGPFLHRPGDDDSAAVTFWGKRDALKMFTIAIIELQRAHAMKHVDAEQRLANDWAGNILKDGSCWNRARLGEPMFILLGRDKKAPAAVRSWVASRVNSGMNKSGDEKTESALRIARDMEAYANE